MFTDGSEIPSGAAVESEVCIIGAGAAGIAMALEFDGAPFRVSLIEAGGFEYPEGGQPSYRGTQSGLRHAELDASRLRYFGGTTNHWGGYCRGLDPIDFERRDWIPHSGWPITLDDITPHYSRAAEIIGLDPHLFDGGYWSSVSGLPALPAGSGRFRTGATLIKPTHFGTAHRERIAGSTNVVCHLNTSVVDLVIGEHESVIREISAVNDAGSRFVFRAKQFVLACGGLENPRLLLNASRVRANGIGNDHDAVGRYFMDHRVTMPGMVLLSGAADLGFYRFNRMPSGQMAEGSLHLSGEAARAERICGAQFSMEPYQSVRSQGDVSLTKLREGVSRFLSGGGWIPDFTSHVGNVARDIDHVAGNLTRKITGGGADLSAWLLKMEVEQTPNPNSRVTLTGDTDSLGLRRIDLHWETREIEKHTVVRSLEMLGEELGRLGIGRVRIDMADDPNVWSRFDTWGYHLAGTTRMSADPKEGVADSVCRVHGVGNLYIAGNSLFPTSGTCNPTFTITALAIRLASHLKGLLA